MSSGADKETKQKYLRILRAFNKTINETDWGDTVFLNAIKQKLIDLKDKFKQETHLTDEDLNLFEEETHPHNVIKRLAEHRGFIEIFILLYNADGLNMEKWKSIIQSIEKQAINRPIYQTEEQARLALRNATNKVNEAYLSVYIKEDELLDNSNVKSSSDRFGQKLVQIKENCLKPDNAHILVHKSGVYEYKNKKLVRFDEVDFF